MTDRSDDKVELLVRSVLAAVDARLAEVRTEIQEVVADAEQRHRELLAQMEAMDHRLEIRAAQAGDVANMGDPLAGRMDEVTQVLLERIEEAHQRNTMATNERFALINTALEQLTTASLAPPTPAVTIPAVTIPSLEAMNAPLRVDPVTGEAPVATTVSTTITLPPIPPLISASPREPSDDDSEPIDMSRLTDLLSERLGSITLPAQHRN